MCGAAILDDVAIADPCFALHLTTLDNHKLSLALSYPLKYLLYKPFATINHTLHLSSVSNTVLTRIVADYKRRVSMLWGELGVDVVVRACTAAELYIVDFHPLSW